MGTRPLDPHPIKPYSSQMTGGLRYHHKDYLDSNGRCNRKTCHQKDWEHVARAKRYPQDVRGLPSSSMQPFVRSPHLTVIMATSSARPPFAPWDLSPGDHKTAPAGAFFRRGWAGTASSGAAWTTGTAHPPWGVLSGAHQKKGSG